MYSFVVFLSTFCCRTHCTRLASLMGPLAMLPICFYLCASVTNNGFEPWDYSDKNQDLLFLPLVFFFVFNFMMVFNWIITLVCLLPSLLITTAILIDAQNKGSMAYATSSHDAIPFNSMWATVVIGLLSLWVTYESHYESCKLLITNTNILKQQQ